MRFGAKWMIGAAAIASLVGVVYLQRLYQSVVVDPPAIKDFMTFYMGAKLVGTPGLYDEQAGLAIQDQLVGAHSTVIPFVRLPFVAYFCKPLLLLPYFQALRLWHATIAVALVLFIWIFPENRLVTLTAVCWSIPVAANFFLGQDSAFLLVWIALCVRLHRMDRPFTAGALLALCLTKFHFLIFLPILVLTQRRWRFAAGFGAGATALVAISFFVQGPHWPIDYINLLIHGNSQTSQDFMPDIRRAFLSSPHALEIHVLGSVITAVLLLVICLRTQFEIAISCCFVGALLVSLHVYIPDYVLTLPLCILLLTRVPDLLPISLLCATPFVWGSMRFVVFMTLGVLTVIALLAPRLTTPAKEMPTLKSRGSADESP